MRTGSARAEHMEKCVSAERIEPKPKTKCAPTTPAVEEKKPRCSIEMAPKPPPMPPPGVTRRAPHEPPFVPKKSELQDLVDICGAMYDEEVDDGLLDDSIDGGSLPASAEKIRKVKTRAGKKIQLKRLKQCLSELGATVMA